jgi:tRNA (guanine-N7-)-methyltransferase
MLVSMVTDSTSPPPARAGGVRTTKRRSRTSPSQIAVFEGLAPRWVVDAGSIGSEADRAQTYWRAAPFLIDIGVGDGRATTVWAEARPDADLLAIELHRPGIVKLLRVLDADGPFNVRVCEGDALAALDAIEVGSVAAIRVLFPDPWPKRRHVARRIVDRAFVRRCGDLLTVGGELHLATDWADYAEHMQTMVATDRRFRPLPPHAAVPRPITAYEQRGLDAGRTISDQVYERIEPEGSGRL